MNWFRKILANSNINVSVGKNNKGYDTVYVSGRGTFNIKDELKDIGFWWDRKKYLWHMPLAFILKDPYKKDRLSQIGVSVPAPVGFQGSTTEPPAQLDRTPQVPIQTPHDQRKNIYFDSKGNPVFVLAKALNLDGEFIVVIKNTSDKNDPDSVFWVSEDRREGVMSSSEFNKFIKPVLDKNGNPYQAKSEHEIHDLFDIARDLKNTYDTQNNTGAYGDLSRIWFLARSIKLPGLHHGDFVGVSKDQSSWIWHDEHGNTGTIENNRVGEFVESVRNNNGVPYKSNNLLELFVIAKNLEDDIQEKNASGRIPEEMITSHQKEVENSFTSTDKNIIMNALAGSGKTTVLRHLASFKKPNEKWLYLVFGRKNADEAKEKFPDDIDVMTSHTFLGSVLRTSSRKGLITETSIRMGKGKDSVNKMSLIVDKIILDDDKIPKHLKYPAAQAINNIAAKSKAYAIDPRIKNAENEVGKIIDFYAIDTTLVSDEQKALGGEIADWRDEIIEKTLEVLFYCLPREMREEAGFSSESLYPKMESKRDHDDTLWIPALHKNVIFPKYDVVLADEVQDFNKCQTIMLDNLAKNGARLICVGDPNQSIFLFRGADSESFNNIESIAEKYGRENAVHQLPQNFRSGKKIIEYVNKNTHVNDLIPGRNHDGEVTEGRDYRDAMSSIYDEWSKNRKFESQTAFLCRSNAPLLKTAIDFVKNHIDFVMLGVDFSKDLIDQIQDITGKGRMGRVYDITSFYEKMNNYLEEHERKWGKKVSKADALKEMRQRIDALTGVWEYLSQNEFKDPNFDTNDPGNRAKMSKVKGSRKIFSQGVKNTIDLVNYLKVRFSGIDESNKAQMDSLRQRDNKSYITLSSAHRSKGLEYERVFILENQLFSSMETKTPAEKIQEKNAQYVAYTRATHELHILNPMEDG